MDVDDDHDALLHAAANRLTKTIRQCEADGMTISQISQALGLPVGDVERLRALDVTDQT